MSIPLINIITGSKYYRMEKTGLIMIEIIKNGTISQRIFWRME